MTANRHPARRPAARRFAIGGVLATVMLLGWTAEAGAAPKADPARASGQISALLAKGQAEAAVSLGEQAVAASPQDGALRAVLGQAYLHAGRFSSAVSALGDAMSLGDGSGRTALGLALAQVAVGQGRDAVATLDRARDVIPAGDLGLALALAGETGRGVDILSDAVRGGAASAKLRQNLAYAYALDGRWNEARMAAAMDVPADQLGARLEQWAMSMRTGAEQERIATLLGAPMVNDAGMPLTLALHQPEPMNPAPAQAAAEPKGELPALAAAQPATVQPAAAPAPAKAPAAPAAEPAPAPAAAPVALAAADPAQLPAAAPVADAAPTPSFVSQPVIQPLPARSVPVRVARARPAAPVVPARAADVAVAAPVTSSGDSHLVQLGAFSSARNAERAKATFLARNASLAGHQFVVSEAKVHGRNFWRVAVSGFDAAGATGLCSSIRSGGGACFAYAGHGPSAPARARAQALAAK